MEFLEFLSRLRGDPMCDPNWSARVEYVAMCVGLPIAFGVFVGMLLKVVERVFGVELGRGGH